MAEDGFMDPVYIHVGVSEVGAVSVAETSLVWST